MDVPAEGCRGVRGKRVVLGGVVGAGSAIEMASIPSSPSWQTVAFVWPSADAVAPTARLVVRTAGAASRRLMDSQFPRFTELAWVSWTREEPCDSSRRAVNARADPDAQRSGISAASPAT